jgi:neutral ceramidase
MKTWVLVILLAAAPAWSGDFRLGRAEVKITPPVGIPMAGYYSIRLAEGKHDDLHAKALVLEKDGAKAAIVVCDLVSIERDLVQAARKLIEKSTGIPGEKVMISATHSHTGPLLRPRFLAAVEGPALQIAEQYRGALPGKIAEAVKLANANLTPARVRAGVGHEESLSFYRRYLMKDGTVRFNPGKLNPNIVQPMGPIDPDVPVLYFDTPDNKPLATYVNFAMHLDTVGGMQFSSDYAYTLSKLLGKIDGPEMLTVFTIGAAGNINHINVKSRDRQKGQEEAKRIGTILTGEVLKTYARTKPVAAVAPRVMREIIDLPVPSFTRDEVAEARSVAARFGKPSPPPFLDMVKAMKVLDIADRKGKPLEAEVQVIALGDQVAWVGLPGEIFVELGIAIKKASPFPITIITELANGWIGYVPTRKAFSEGAYEVVSARCAPGAGETLADAAIRMLAALHRGESAD